MKRACTTEPKRNHEVVVVDFFGEGKNLEAWQLGWQQDEKVEAKSSVSKKILDWRYGILWKNRSRLGQCAGADWDTFDAAKLMIFSETVAF